MSNTGNFLRLGLFTVTMVASVFISDAIDTDAATQSTVCVLAACALASLISAVGLGMTAAAIVRSFE